MKNGKYYYGEPYDPKLLTRLSYPYALKQKIKWAEDLVLKLNAMPIFIESEGIHYPIRDMQRLNKALKSIRDNQYLLDELRGRE